MFRQLDRILDIVHRILAVVERVERLLRAQGILTMSTLSDLQAQVAATLTVEQSAITLINGIPALIAAAGTDAAALADLQAQLKASAASLAAAVTANTPAATPVPVQPAPAPPAVTPDPAPPVPPAPDAPTSLAVR
jgi:hypothetical protein